jgi:hypothetical protein
MTAGLNTQDPSLRALLYKQICTWFPLGVFLFGFYYFCLRILGPGLDYIPGDLGDSRFINYVFEHGYLFLSGKEKSFWAAGFMYPYRHTIALSDNLSGTLPLYAFFRFLGFSAETSYQCWWLAVCSLNYWCCFIVIRCWARNSLLAACGAFIFTFGIFNLSQLNYMQMIIRFPIPLVLYAAYRLVLQPTSKYFILFAAGLVLQMYCVIYTGFLLFYFSLLFILCLSYFHRSFSFFQFCLHRKNIVLVLTTCIVSFLLILGLMLPYFETAKETGFRLYREVVPNLPTLHSYFFPAESSITWHFLFANGKAMFREWWLQDIFPGLFVYAGFCATGYLLIRRTIRKEKNDPLCKSLFVCSLLVFLMFTRTASGYTLYGALIKLPGMNSMRVLTRFMHVQLFFLILLGVFSCVAIFGKTKNGPLLFLLLTLLVFADNLFRVTDLPRTSKVELQERILVLKEKLKGFNGSKCVAVAYLPPNSNAPYIDQLDMMIAAQQMHIPTVNGYSSSCPPDFGPFFIKCDDVGLKNWLDKNKIAPEHIYFIR